MTQPPETDTSQALVASDLVKAYAGRRVVDRVSFAVQPGEIVGLLGPNGAGKTTSFSMVVGLVKPDAGSVRLGMTELASLPMHLRARAGLGYLPQEASIFRKLTVKENLLAVLELDKSLTAPQRHEKADALIAEFGLGHVANNKGENLSGGERRRTEIARSLIPHPRFMLFDEPFAGIDPINVAELQGEVTRLKARGLGILITDHNVRDTLGICDRAYIIVSGAIVESGSPQQLAQSPSARKLYLGEGFRLA